MRTTVALLCAVSCVAVFAGGCSDSGAGPQLPPDPEFRDRTTPEDVIYNLQLAYVEMDAGEYLDCLSEDFIFYPSEADLQNPDPQNPMPDEWYKTDERGMHENMFYGPNAVESITLNLTTVNVQHNEGLPGPEDDIYVYVESVDLMVNLYGDLSYLATSDSQYWFRVDTDQTGENGEPWWEIYMWYDLSEAPGTRGGGSGRVEDSSWGSIKALYRSR